MQPMFNVKNALIGFAFFSAAVVIGLVLVGLFIFLIEVLPGAWSLVAYLAIIGLGGSIAAGFINWESDEEKED